MSNPLKSRRKWRSAVAAVEFAVVLPPVVLLILGSLDVARVFAIQHTLQEASMNGCRLYALGDMTQQQAIAAVDQSMAEKSLTGYTIVFDPPLKSDINDDMQPVTVAVQMPYDSFGLGLQSILGGSSITAQSILPADTLGSAMSAGT